MDFSYEVSRSIAACEGTFDCRCSTKYTGSNNLKSILSLENDLEIIPVLNKVDLPSANPEVSDDIVDLLGCKLEDIIYVGKTGLGRKYFAVIERIPPPKGNVDDKL
jgi:GTP-binding protein LepA